jgi:hypothetical protein
MVITFGVGGEWSSQFSAGLYLVCVRQCAAIEHDCIESPVRYSGIHANPPVGAAEGCDLLILFLGGLEIAKDQDQKIAAFGSSDRVQ